MSNTSGGIKNHSRKKDSSRERDRTKSVASESGGSSQCDTPPLIEKDGGPSQGRFAGISSDSVQCMADQVGAEINLEAATNLAEDVSYKLRQMISTLAIHSELMKKTRIDSWDVNTAFMLADTSPVVGASYVHYTQVGEEKIYCPVEELINVPEFALTPQTYVYSSIPTISVEWITDEKSLNHNSNMSVQLYNYYTKVARALLNLRRKPKEMAVEDLMTNTRIGPIFPNLFNLAVLVLNNDNLNALNVRAKIPLQTNILDMVDALCANPCCADTNIQQQFQRLFPIMVSNILSDGALANEMYAILTKIIRTWPSFIRIGKGILTEYLAYETEARLTGPMIKCLMALGREALVECLGDNLEYLDNYMMVPRPKRKQNDIRETLLDVSTCLLRSEPTIFLEDYVATDYALYEMMGDSILPRRTVFPNTDYLNSDETNTDKTSDEDISYTPLRIILRRPKLRLIPALTPKRTHREQVFEPTKFSCDNCIRIKIKNCRTLKVPRRHQSVRQDKFAIASRGVVVASGMLHRFKYKLNKPREPAPYYAAMFL